MMRKLSAGQWTALALSLVFTLGTITLALAGGLAHGRTASSSTHPFGFARPAAGLVTANGTELSEVTDRALHAIVWVGPSTSSGAPVTAGSGVLVGPDTVLIDAQLVAGATEFVVTAFDRRRLVGRLIGTDSFAGLAALNVAGDLAGMTPLAFADSSLCKVGQVVLAISDSPDAGRTVRLGVISASAHDSGEAYQPFLRSDAVRAGDAGGVLLDLAGHVAGVPVRALGAPSDGRATFGLILPSNTARTIMKSLLANEPFEHGDLGVVVQDIDAELRQALALPSSRGVLVADVTADAPGARAGLDRGDVIVAIDDRALNSAAEFRARVAAAKPGSTLGLDVVREGLRRTLEAQPRRAPGPPALPGPAASAAPRALGMSLATLDRGELRRRRIPESLAGGLLVKQVTPGTASALAGLTPGDIVLEIGHEPATDPARTAQLWQRSSGPQAVLAWRAHGTFYTALMP